MAQITSPGVTVRNVLDVAIDLDEIHGKVREFAERKQPGEDGAYYVNKSEIKKAAGLTEEQYEDYVYSARVYGYLEPTGHWFRITDVTNFPTLAGGYVISNNLGAQMASVSMQASNLQSVFNLPSQDYDPPGPSQGDMYFNTKLNEVRIFDGGGWLKLSTSSAAPCP